MRRARRFIDRIELGAHAVKEAFSLLSRPPAYVFSGDRQRLLLRNSGEILARYLREHRTIGSKTRSLYLKQQGKY
jgi:hypothetical protein